MSHAGHWTNTRNATITQLWPLVVQIQAGSRRVDVSTFIAFALE
jgi:hypothetical protein